MTLVISKQLLEKLVSHRRSELPREACGLIAGVKVGNDMRVKEIYPLTNVAKSPWLYKAKPEELYNAMEEIEKAGLTVLGVYHSHPVGGPEPSEIDRRNAYYPGLVYLIVSFTGGRASVGAYLWDGERFTKESLAMEG